MNPAPAVADQKPAAPAEKAEAVAAPASPAVVEKPKAETRPPKFKDFEAWFSDMLKRHGPHDPYQIAREIKTLVALGVVADNDDELRALGDRVLDAYIKANRGAVNRREHAEELLRNYGLPSTKPEAKRVELPAASYVVAFGSVPNYPEYGKRGVFVRGCKDRPEMVYVADSVEFVGKSKAVKLAKPWHGQQHAVETDGAIVLTFEDGSDSRVFNTSNGRFVG